MHNVCTQYSVQASRMLSSTIYNSEKCFCSQSGEHGWVKQLSRRFFHLVNDLHSLKFIASSITDKAKFQYVFGKQEVPRNKYEFLEFHMSVLMNLLSAYPGTCPEYKDFGVFVNWFPSFHMARISLKEDLASTKPS